MQTKRAPSHRRRAKAHSVFEGVAWFIAFAAATGLTLLLILRTFVPFIGTVTYQYEDHDAVTTSLPFFVHSDAKHLTVTVPVTVPPFASRSFLIHPDDCAEKITINGQELPPDKGVICLNDSNQVRDLSGYIRTGENTIILSIRDDGGSGGLVMMAQFGWIWAGVLLALWLGLLLMGAVLFLEPFIAIRSRITLLGIFLFGIWLRISYVAVTTFDSRSHDTGAHVDYIRYMAQNGTIPVANDGWEYHQAPLYYAITGLWMRIEQFLGLSEPQTLRHLQYFALFLSVVTLALTIWAGSLLLKQRRHLLPLFAGVLAVFPTLVSLSSQITNEVLYFPLAVLSFCFIVLWWRDGKLLYWYGAVVLIALSFLTKMSATSLIPVAGLCLLLRPGTTVLTKLRATLASMMLFILLAGWLPAIRFLVETDHDRMLTFGNEGMNDSLRVPNELQNYTTFNPAAMLEIPFINSWDDKTRRQYFWEYFFRSAFFGEYEFKNQLWVATNILALGLSLLPLLLLGLIDTLLKRFKENVPLLLTCATVLGAAVYYRFRYSYAPNQDFRFSLLLLLPFSYFLVCACAALPQRYQPHVRVWTGLFLGMCAAFMIALCLQPY